MHERPARRGGVLADVVSFLAVVLIGTIVGAFSVLDVSAFLVGAGSGGVVVALAMVPGFAGKVWRFLTGDDEDGGAW